jgi:hypothetical protein
VKHRAWLLATLVIALAVPSFAVETQLWITDAPADYARSEARGVIVGPDGVLSLGPEAASSPADSMDVVWALAVLADGSVAMAGDRGRIDRWSGGRVRPWVRLPVGQVLSLARDGDGLVAGTGPGGRIYRIGAKGDTSLIASTGERYVWGIVPAGKNAWYAATGTRGRLMKVTPGKATIVLDTDESNLVSIASDGNGGVYAGGDSKGRVFAVRANGTTRTLFDATEDEVRALAVSSDGSLYAAALSASSIVADEPDKDDEPSAAGADRVAPVIAPTAGGRAVVYRIVPDSSVASVWTAPHPLVFALAAVRQGKAPARIVAGTGNRAALFALTQPGATQWLALPQGQVTALTTDDQGRLYAATSNPGALWRVGPGNADQGELQSGVFDARRIARFGRVAWHGSSTNGSVRLETRSGNTDAPDTTWSRWAAPGTRSRSVSPSARYFQWRATLAGGQTRVSAVEVAWKEQNLAPRVEELTVAPQGTGFREGEMQPRVEPVTQTLPGGQKVEYSITTSTQRALRGLPAFARGLRTLAWKGFDPNGDPLEYRVDVRREDGNEWMELGKELEATSFTWDTNALPDGMYRIRVQVNDQPGNAVGEGLNGETLSEPFRVDNTPPAITSLEARGESGAVVVSGAAEDGQNMLTRLEAALDDGDWRTLTPDGGLADDRALTFKARLPDVKEGPHTVAVRVVDLAGNLASRAVHVNVPARR